MQLGFALSVNKVHCRGGKKPQPGLAFGIQVIVWTVLNASGIIDLQYCLRC